MNAYLVTYRRFAVEAGILTRYTLQDVDVEAVWADSPEAARESMLRRGRMRSEPFAIQDIRAVEDIR